MNEAFLQRFLYVSKIFDQNTCRKKVISFKMCACPNLRLLECTHGMSGTLLRSFYDIAAEIAIAICIVVVVVVNVVVVVIAELDKR